MSESVSQSVSYGLQQNTTFQFCRDDAFEFVELQFDLREIAKRFFYSYLQICRRVTARLIRWYRYSTESPAPSPTSVINYITVLKQCRISECNCSPFPPRHTHILPLLPHPARIILVFVVVVVLLFYTSTVNICGHVGTVS